MSGLSLPEVREVKERPILFSAPMVRAILSGAKTQTRRIVKPQPAHPLDVTAPGLWLHKGARSFNLGVTRGVYAACPYGQPGDRLWCKETWSAPPAYDAVKPRDLATNTPIRFAADGMVHGVSKRFVDADGRIVVGRLRPSIFMRRWMSRITLEVTGVRVERVQEISEADAKAEGARYLPDLPLGPYTGKDVPRWSMEDPTDTDEALGGPRWAFANLWKKINGAESWAANPWVWVVEFKRVEVAHG